MRACKIENITKTVKQNGVCVDCERSEYRVPIAQVTGNQRVNCGITRENGVLTSREAPSTPSRSVPSLLVVITAAAAAAKVTYAVLW